MSEWIGEQKDKLAVGHDEPTDQQYKAAAKLVCAVKGVAVIAGGAVVVAAMWAFVGFERIVGDHEVGASWEPFIKHRPSLQMRFENPAQKGLEIVEFENLSPDDQAAFTNFCAFRFGTTDAARCSAALVGRMV